MIEATRIESFSARSIGVVFSCLFAFLFQTSNATVSYHFTPVETVINSVNQAKNDVNKNYDFVGVRTHRLKVSNQQKYGRLYFAICNNCYWCASCIRDETKFDSCPSCLGTRIRSIPISTGGCL